MSRLVLSLLLALHCGSAPAAGPHRSEVAFTLPDRELLPESVAFDPHTGDWLVGSTRRGKIVRVDAGGAVSDFVAPRADGLWMVIGIKADPARRRLWVASSDGGNLVGYQKSDRRAAGLFSFDLDTGALTSRHTLSEPGVEHFFNDIALCPDGDVYVTHMFDAAQIWKLDAATATFAPFYRGDSAFRNPNGIAFTGDGRYFIVAHDGGLSRIDLRTRERRALTAPAGISLRGVDGLYVHGAGIIAIQPGAKRVVRWSLDAEALRVTAEDVLEADHPLFDQPTTGALAGDWFHYVANAQFGRFDQEGPAALQPPVVLKLRLAP